MENFRVIELHRTRDFGSKVNATFEFIKQNFRGLFSSILLIAGPPTLLGSLIVGSFFSDMMNMFRQAAFGGADPEIIQSYIFSPNLWMNGILMMVFFTVSGVMNIATINNYIILYGEKRTNKISVGEVWERVRSTFWMYFSTLFLMIILWIVAYLVLLIPIGILAAISETLVVVGFILFLCVLVYLVFGVSLVFFIRGYEKRGFMDSIARSFRLVKDKWWSTFGLLFILYLIMMVTSYLFMIPGYIIMVVSSLHTTSPEAMLETSSTWITISTVGMTLYYLMQMLLAALPMVGIAFQYFNLVELKEAKGLIADIETLGQSPTSTPTDDQY